jgi:hypothetical protein
MSISSARSAIMSAATSCETYNGINYSYLLNLRIDTALDATNVDRVADLVWANRIRREVLAICEQNLKAIAEREQQETSPDELNRAVRAGARPGAKVLVPRDQRGGAVWVG